MAIVALKGTLGLRGATLVAEPELLKIGLLLPPDEPQSRSVREGVLLAQEQASKSATTQLEMIIRGRVGQWGADGVEAARMVTDDGAEGLIAPPDGAASHLTLQVSGRTAVPVITLCADSSVGRTGVPWMLRIVPRTTDEAKALFSGLGAAASGRTNRWLVLVPDGRVGRETSRDLSQFALGRAIRFEKIIEVNPTLTNAEFVCSQVLNSDAQIVLLWLPAAPAGKTAKYLRTAGYRGILAGPGVLQCEDFVLAAGDALEGFIVPAIIRSEASTWQTFQTAYRQHWQRQPDTMAAMSYDAAMLLSHLLRQPEFQTPPHRLAHGFSCSGATGELSFDTEGNRVANLELLRAHEGKFIRILKPN